MTLATEFVEFMERVWNDPDDRCNGGKNAIESAQCLGARKLYPSKTGEIPAYTFEFRDGSRCNVNADSATVVPVNRRA